MLFLDVDTCPTGAVDADSNGFNLLNRLDLKFALHNAFSGSSTTSLEEIESTSPGFFVSLWTASPSAATLQLTLEYLLHPTKTLHVMTPYKVYPKPRDRSWCFTDESKLISLSGAELRGRRSSEFFDQRAHLFKHKPLIY